MVCTATHLQWNQSSHALHATISPHVSRLKTSAVKSTLLWFSWLQKLGFVPIPYGWRHLSTYYATLIYFGPPITQLVLYIKGKWRHVIVAATSFTDCAMASVCLYTFPHTVHQFPLFYGVHSFDFLISYKGALSCHGGPVTASASCRKLSTGDPFQWGTLICVITCHTGTRAQVHVVQSST